MTNSNYGYSFNLEKEDKNQLDSLIYFSHKNDVDFYFNENNLYLIEKILNKNDFKKVSEEDTGKEKEIIYKKEGKEIFLYI